MDVLAVRLDPVGAGDLRHLVIERHLRQRLSIDKHHAAAVQIRRHIGLIVFDKETVMQDIDRAEGVIAPEIVRVQLGLPNDRLRAVLHRHIETTQVPVRAARKRRCDNGRLNDCLAVASRLVGDHARGALAAALRAYRLAVGARVDDHARTGFRESRRRIDRQKRMIRGAVVCVARRRMVTVDVELAVVLLLHLPIVKILPVRKQGARLF